MAKEGVDLEQWVWLPDDEWGYVPGKYLAGREREDQRNVVFSSFELSDKQIRYYPYKDLSELYQVSSQALWGSYDNLVNLDDLCEGALLHQLRQRYYKDDIYTSIGSILVSINPYKLLPIYTEKVLKQYVDNFKSDDADLKPHAYQLAANAFRAVLESDLDQSIIISGESGAGKTEATKLVLQYLSQAAAGAKDNESQDSIPVQEQVLQSNPILEAFGNAKTERNDNSSRFGKWVQVHFTRSGAISSASIVNYLLEKSRVVQLGPNERNYHSFYQLCRGCSPELRKALHLGDGKPSSFHYLNQSGCDVIPGVNDELQYEATVNAMRWLGLQEDEIDEIWQLVSAVLNLGNIEIVNANQSEVSEVRDPASLQVVAELLQVDADALQNGLLYRSVTIRGETSHIPLKLHAAIDARDALAKALYGKLFDWLVVRINKALLRRRGGSDLRSIGILDIFGFEIFEENAFEQFCINYANEKLQQHFTSFIFKQEQEEYKAEGLSVGFIQFVDNQETLDLIESRPPGVMGILSLVDQEVFMPQGNDDSLVTNMHQQFGKKKGGHPSYEKILRNRDAFIIKHYAGAVAYNVKGFIHKNSDQLHASLLELVRTSKVLLATEIFKPSDANDQSTVNMERLIGGKTAKPVLDKRGLPKFSRSSKKARAKTLLQQFSTQLRVLYNRLCATEPHFIRCIKPNVRKCPGEVNATLVLRQMRYAGLMEAIHIRRSGYPFRMSQAQLLRRYRHCLPAEQRGELDAKAGESSVTGCRFLFEKLSDKVPLKDVAIGFSKVFMRHSAKTALNKIREQGLHTFAVKLQAWYRGSMWRRRLKPLQELHARCKQALGLPPLDVSVAELDEIAKTSCVLSESDDYDDLDFGLLLVKHCAALRTFLSEQDSCIDQLKQGLELYRMDVLDCAVKAATKLEADASQLPSVVSGLTPSSPLHPDVSALKASAEQVKSRIVRLFETFAPLRDSLASQDNAAVQSVVDKIDQLGREDPSLLSKFKSITVLVSYAQSLLKLQAQQAELKEEVLPALEQWAAVASFGSEDLRKYHKYLTVTQENLDGLQADFAAVKLPTPSTQDRRSLLGSFSGVARPQVDPSISVALRKAQQHLVIACRSRVDHVFNTASKFQASDKSISEDGFFEACDELEAVLKELQQEDLLAQTQSRRAEVKAAREKAVAERKAAEAKAAEAKAAEAKVADAMKAAERAESAAPETAIEPVEVAEELSASPPQPAAEDVEADTAKPDKGHVAAFTLDEKRRAPQFPSLATRDVSHSSILRETAESKQRAASNISAYSIPTTHQTLPAPPKKRVTLIPPPPGGDKPVWKPPSTPSPTDGKERSASDTSLDANPLHAVVYEDDAMLAQQFELFNLRVQEAKGEVPPGSADSKQAEVEAAFRSSAPGHESKISISLNGNMLGGLGSIDEASVVSRSGAQQSLLGGVLSHDKDFYGNFINFADRYPLSQFPRLRQEENYAKRQFGRRTRVKASMLQWQKNPIPRSICKLSTDFCGGKKQSKRVKKLAKDLFEDIKAFMQDKFAPYPISNGLEVLRLGIEEPLLRDEIYVQLMKQTTDNPNNPLLGYKLMYLCAKTFVPSMEVYPYILSHLAPRAHELQFVKIGGAKTLHTVHDLCTHIYFALKRTIRSNRKRDNNEIMQQLMKYSDIGELIEGSYLPQPPPTELLNNNCEYLRAVQTEESRLGALSEAPSNRSSLDIPPPPSHSRTPSELSLPPPPPPMPPPPDAPDSDNEDAVSAPPPPDDVPPPPSPQGLAPPGATTFRRSVYRRSVAPPPPPSDDGDAPPPPPEQEATNTSLYVAGESPRHSLSSMPLPRPPQPPSAKPIEKPVFDIAVEVKTPAREPDSKPAAPKAASPPCGPKDKPKAKPDEMLLVPETRTRQRSRSLGFLDSTEAVKEAAAAQAGVALHDLVLDEDGIPLPPPPEAEPSQEEEVKASTNRRRSLSTTRKRLARLGATTKGGRKQRAVAPPPGRKKRNVGPPPMRRAKSTK